MHDAALCTHRGCWSELHSQHRTMLDTMCRDEQTQRTLLGLWIPPWVVDAMTFPPLVSVTRTACDPPPPVLLLPPVLLPAAVEEPLPDASDTGGAMGG